MTERVLLYSTKSRCPILAVIGEGGATSVEVRTDGSGDPWGVMDIHSRTQRQESELTACYALGQCYPMCPAFQGGHEVAQYYHYGREEAAWSLLEDWYLSQIGED